MNNPLFLRQAPLVGSKGQETLRKSHVVIVGVGALGSVAAELLVRSGVGTLTLIDRDIVEISNLQRQSLFVQKDVGRSKVLVAKEHLLQINESVSLNIHAVQLNAQSIAECIDSDVDLILDCTDNMSTRFLINDYTKKKKLDWIFASAIASSGMLRLITRASACLRCQSPAQAHGDTCAEAGVFAMTTHTVASMQSHLALRYLLKDDLDLFENILFLVDLNKMGIRQFAVQHNSACSTCNGDFLSLDGTSNQRVIQFCSLGQYQVSGNRKVDLKALSLTVEKEFDDVILDEVSLRFGKLVVFADGRALIHSKTEKEAISLYDTYIGN